MMNIRLPAFAGTFYPSDKDELQTLIQTLLNDAAFPSPDDPLPKALVIPHSNYLYSGPIAASACKRILPLGERIRRVILLGPSHRLPFNGMAVSSAQRFMTPLGEIKLDRTAIAQILKQPQVCTLDQAHEQEHSLEVQLPFLQTILKDFRLVPLVVGQAEARDVASVLNTLWGGEETLILISSDLSHYHSQAVARELDAITTQAIEHLHLEDISYDHACGRNPLRGLLEVARMRGMKAQAIDVRNSGDTMGSKDRVVGYGAYMLHGAVAA